MSVLKELVGEKTHNPALDPIRRQYERYCEYVHHGKWHTARHLHLVCDALQRIESGDLQYLMICMPPRHGKSQSVTETFPSYFIGKNPDRQVIEVSYGDNLAKKFGNLNRKYIEEFGEELFGIRIDRRNGSKTDWKIDGHDGSMLSVGIGGGITGQGADLLIIDDVVKNRQEAESPVYRDKIWSEWNDTLSTRLSPAAAVIVIMTRWHEDDLAGRLLDSAEDSGIRWEVLELRALAEENDLLGRQPGEPLWPERFSLDWLMKKKKAVGTRTWEALYQQHPKPPNAIKMFQREWFEIVRDYPHDARSVRYWDLAATEAKTGKDPDWTSGGRISEKNGIFYIVDIRHEQLSPFGVEKLVKQTAVTDGRKVRIHMEQEPGSSGVNTIDHYRRAVLKGYSFYGDKKTSNKVERALPLSAAAEAGNVKLVMGAWNKAFLDEAEAFPDGKHDDMVDCATGGFTMLNNTRFGILDFYKEKAKALQEKMSGKEGKE